MLRRVLLIFVVLASAGASLVSAAEPKYEAELVFPLNPQHNHAPGIVECPSGDLLVSWYRGSGERKSDDVAVYGARKRSGAKDWSEPFLMADHPDFPDCNTCMMIDNQKRLWLFWPIVIDNNWDSCLTNFFSTGDYQGDGAPKWRHHGVIFLKPDDFGKELVDHVIAEYGSSPLAQTDFAKERLEKFKARANDKLYQRLGWQTRCKPTILPSGRILLPLYSDTFSISLMAISDDGGRNWKASKPLIGIGAIQPSVLRRKDGTLVAYMRENGPKHRIRVCESTDDGMTWGKVGVSDLPNPGAGIDGVVLADGTWLMVYNDAIKGRNTLAVSLSDDEGKTWTATRHLEKQEKGSYHYPAVIQGHDGTIHAIYSYFSEDEAAKGKSMKHAAFNAEWVRAGDGK